MSKLDELIREFCSGGVAYKEIWSLTAWDKNFNSVNKSKQKKVCKYTYYLAADLKTLECDHGNVKILTTSISDLWANEDEVLDTLSEGEIVCIPWGGNPVVQYYNGKFITGDNRIATSLDTLILSNKYLYYCLQNQIAEIASFYRGSGIKHPDMSKVLDLRIPLPPLPVQREIVQILDNFTELTAGLTAELTAELTARKKQYEYYRSKLLRFDDSPEMKWMNFEECCTLSRGDYVTKKDAQTGNIPVILGGLKPAYYIDRSNHSGRAIVVSRSGASAGFVSYWNEPIFVTDGFIVEAKENTNIRYLYLYFKSTQDIFHASKRGAGIPHITGKFISSLKIPVPSLKEQERIVSILDRFNTLYNGITTGLSAEIEARKKQYDHYRDKLLTFPEAHS